ncbi:MAG: type II toxin-antitoxin system Phd/YefM family antitoxin [Nostoc sp.]|uniref:type II toxin-antitoxin system Phd/YefM family antitoxin n=1 Tax=Nostoc sp. TaxID=1180 RepID=UPI002FF8473C
MLNISRDIHSLSSFKRNTLEFLQQMKQTGKPVVLTVNGKAELVVQDAESYQKLLDALERLEAMSTTGYAYAGIKQGLEDVEAGRTSTLSEFEQEMQQKYGISS